MPEENKLRFKQIIVNDLINKKREQIDLLIEKLYNELNKKKFEEESKMKFGSECFVNM